MRRATNSCQKPPESKKEAIRHFHHLIREISLEGEQVDEKLGRFHLSCIANVDQTPLHHTNLEYDLPQTSSGNTPFTRNVNALPSEFL